MPFPTVDCGGVELPDACCTSLWDLAQDVLSTVVPFMEECIVPSDCAPPMRYFVSIGKPETWMTNYLALYLENIRLDVSSNRGSRMLTPPVILGQFRFLLTESNYPGLVQDGQKLFTPTDDDFHRASKHGYSHAQALLRGLLSYAADNDCSNFLLRDLQPTRPEAYNAGWSLGFDLEIR